MYSRYAVESVLEWLASGMSTEEILADYENLEREDVMAVLSYAAFVDNRKATKEGAARLQAMRARPWKPRAASAW